MSDGRTLQITCTSLARDTIAALESDVRYVVHEGSTRSSKTQSICQALIATALRRPLEIDVVRESMPVLRRSAYKDFVEWLKEYDLYDERLHNKTEEIIALPCAGGASKIRFYGADEEQKLQGPERDIAWINEANEVSGQVFRQIRRRTRETLVMDYNPSHGSSHWIDADVIGSGRETVIHSTYRDNPFLPDAQIEDIEADVPVYREADGTEVVDWDLTYEGDGVLIAGDPAEWAVNGLGKRAKSDRIIFPHWTLVDRVPESPDDRAMGLDFGWNAPCVLEDIYWKDVVGEDVNCIWDEIFRDTKLRNADLVGLMEKHGVPKHIPIYCDHEPDRIDYLKEQGYNAKPAAKADYAATVRKVKDYRLRITRTSQVLREEMEGLKWGVDGDGKILDEPVKEDDHGPDAGRYGTHSHKSGKTSTGGGGRASMRGSTSNGRRTRSPKGVSFR